MQRRLQALLDKFVEEKRELGIQVAAYRDGKLLVNASAGFMDEAHARAVDERTLFPVFSTTKGIAATIIHILAERGTIAYDDPIAKYWPDFGANGKQGITIRQALNHSAGVPQMPRGIGFEDLRDWDGMCARVAALEPLWSAGSRTEYHAVTYGWIVGEVARRAEGRTFQALLSDEICRPLGLDRLYVGIPDEVEGDVATLYHPGEGPREDDGQPQCIAWWLWPLHACMNRPDARKACNPAVTGIMNALSIARHYASLLPGGIEGVELLPPERIRIAVEVDGRPDDVGDGSRHRRGLGYAFDPDGTVFGSVGAFGHGGHGGSDGFADPASGLAVGITRNLFSDDETRNEIRALLRTAC